jgi:hypothetical protein
MFFMLFFGLGIQKISSINTETNVSKYLLRTLFIKHMNVVGASVIPTGTTKNAYEGRTIGYVCRTL